MSAPVLVTLPGFGMTRRTLLPLGGLALDLPGQGERPAIAGGLEAWVAKLAEQLPARCNVLGWSLGATLALALAIARPTQVNRLILVAATPRFVNGAGWNRGMPAPAFSEFEESVAQDAPAALLRFTALQAQGDREERRVLRELRVAACRSGETHRAALADSLAVLRDTDLRQQLPGIQAATLVIAGGQDRLVPAAAGQYLQETMPNARVCLFPEAAHAPFCSDHAGFMRLLADFLQEND